MIFQIVPFSFPEVTFSLLSMLLDMKISLVLNFVQVLSVSSNKIQLHWFNDLFHLCFQQLISNLNALNYIHFIAPPSRQPKSKIRRGWVEKLTQLMIRRHGRLFAFQGEVKLSSDVKGWRGSQTSIITNDSCADKLMEGKRVGASSNHRKSMYRRHLSEAQMKSSTWLHFK